MDKQIFKNNSQGDFFSDKSLKEKEERFILSIKENGIYDKIIFESEFLGLTKKIICRCKEHLDCVWETQPNYLMKGQYGCQKCVMKKKEETREKNGWSMVSSLSNEEFLKRFNETGNPEEIEILEPFHGFGTDKKLKCWCKKGQHEFYMNPLTLLQGYHCLECSYKERGEKKKKTAYDKLLKYIEDNDLQLELQEDYINTKTKIKFRCKVCGNEWIVSPDKILQGRRCPFCNDSISFPNKILRIVLSILKPQNYDVEYGKPWNYEIQYDGYFEKDNTKYLIEMDGTQHKNRPRQNNWANYEKQHRIDLRKDEEAKISNYKLIRIDCEGTNKQIIDTFKNSELKDILDFSKVDWVYVLKQAEKSLVKQVCDYIKENPNDSSKEIGEKFNISDGTVRIYVERGIEFNYISKELSFSRNNLNKRVAKRTKSSKTSPNRDGTIIKVFNVNDLNTPIHIFKSVNDCSRYYRQNYNEVIDRHEVTKMLSGKRKEYKNLFFQYATSEDLEKYKDLIRELDKSIHVH